MCAEVHAQMLHSTRKSSEPVFDIVLAICVKNKKKNSLLNVDNPPLSPSCATKEIGH